MMTLTIESRPGNLNFIHGVTWDRVLSYFTFQDNHFIVMKPGCTVPDLVPSVEKDGCATYIFPQDQFDVKIYPSKQLIQRANYSLS